VARSAVVFAPTALAALNGATVALEPLSVAVRIFVRLMTARCFVMNLIREVASSVTNLFLLVYF
jgi:hypothetical protein